MTKNSSDEQADVHEARELASELEALVYKAGVAGYNLERSFTDNCKEISGKGLTAEEARRKWGINK